MSKHANHESAGAVATEVGEHVKADAAEDPRPKQPPRYAVIIHDDDDITFTFVIMTLVKVLKISGSQAQRHADTTDRAGRCAVWSGLKEHAELKAQQITSAGLDPFSMSEHRRPLKATIEPVPGT